MKLRDCVLLLTSYELDSFPRTLPAPEASGLLNGWVALWHPRLLAALQAVPRWQSAAQLPGELHDILFVLPSISVDKLEADGEQRIADAGGHLLRPTADTWRAFQDQLLTVASQAGLLDAPPPDSSQPSQPIQPPELSPPSDASPAAASEALAEAQADAADNLVEELRADFAALGYAYLQIQLMTRQLRYTSNLDLQQFGSQLTSAATAALANDRAEAERWLQSCFDALGQERDHYYSLDVHLIDITLLASTTLGKSLTAQLDRSDQPQSPPTSYLACGELLRQWSKNSPQSLSQLRTAMQHRQACLVGGLDLERPHPLMSREGIARDFVRGRAAYSECGFDPPRVFARHTYGLSPDSVPMLRRWGFAGCLLIAWGEGKYPHGAQPKISWEAPDGTFLSALAAEVLDAADPTSYLALGWKIGDALEHQHVPTIIFAHWPNRSCEFVELLSRICRRTPALGKWKLADDYFADTDQPYHQERLSSDSFQYSWLKHAAAESMPAQLQRSTGQRETGQASVGDTLGSQAGAARWRVATQLNHQLQATCRGLQNLLNLAWQLEHFHRLGTAPATATATATATAGAPSGATTNSSDSASEKTPAEAVTEAEQSGQLGQPGQTVTAEDRSAAHEPPKWSDWAPEFAQLADLVDSLWDAPSRATEIAAEATELADRLRTVTLERLARQLHTTGIKKADSSAQHAGRLLLNPRCAPVRVITHTLADQQLAQGESWNFAEGRVGEGRVTCVDIPAHGFVVTPVQADSKRATPKHRPLADAGGLLHNEFLELQIDPSRGHLRSLHVPAKRGNRLSLMIARRDQIPSDAQRPAATASSSLRISEMVATKVEMLTSSNICGVVSAEGYLQFDGQRAADFRIVYEVWRGSRIAEVNIRLQNLQPLSADNPWQSAYVLRLAWPSEAAVLRTYSAGQRHSWAAGRGISPTLIEIDEVDYRTHYLTGGLAFHRRSEDRFLETVLASAGETQVEHRIGIGVDLPHANLAAEQFPDTPYEIELSRSQPIAASSGWMATVDQRNVIVQLESPLVDQTGALVGMRLFVSELEGKATSANIRLLREVASATRVDYLGGKISQLNAVHDRITIALRAHEQVNVDVLWQL